MARYEAGETLASIARTYDCSPPAISYIVSRSRERQPSAEPPVTAAEPQLVKANAEPVVALAAPAVQPVLEPALVGAGGGDRSAAMTATMTRPTPRPTAGNGAAHPVPPAGADRRTLHLSLGGNGVNGTNGHGNGHANGASPDHGENGYRQSAPPSPPAEPRPSSPPPRYAYQPNANAESESRKKDAGTFIDQELRARVDGDIAVFLAAFDAALAGDTLESRAGLREATDRLLRAGARTRIELERLEARVPLASSRDGNARPEPNWRHR